MTTWLITGASSGLGAALARAVAERGDNVVATARDVTKVQALVDEHPDTALAMALDVTDHDQITHVITAALDRFGAVDVVVNNAGHGYRAAVEEAADSDVEELFATNFFGPIDVIQQILPHMRSRRSGTIINVSSIGAVVSNPGSGHYTATKTALEGVSDALNREVSPLGIRVMAVEPGAFRTDFAGRSLTQSATAIADYSETAGRRRKENDHSHGTQPGDPAKAAKVIIDIVDRDQLPFRLLLGPDAVRVARDELHERLAELEAFAPVSSTTDFTANSN